MNYLAVDLLTKQHFLKENNQRKRKHWFKSEVDWKRGPVCALHTPLTGLIMLTSDIYMNM